MAPQLSRYLILLCCSAAVTIQGIRVDFHAFHGWQVETDTDADMRREIDACNATREVILDVCTRTREMSCLDMCGFTLTFDEEDLAPNGWWMPLCSCDALCHIYGDCCPDYDVLCEQEHVAEAERWKSLLGVKIECQRRYLVIASCIDTNVSDAYWEKVDDPLEPIVSEAGTGLQFKNRHIYSCNKMAVGLHNMTKWRKKIKTFESEIMPQLGHLAATGLGNESLRDYIFDEPGTIQKRQCYRYAEVECGTPGKNCLKSKRTKMPNVLSACQYVLAERNNTDWNLKSKEERWTSQLPDFVVKSSLGTTQVSTTTDTSQLSICYLEVYLSRKQLERSPSQYSFELDFDVPVNMAQLKEFYCVEDFETVGNVIRKSEKVNLPLDGTECWDVTAIVLLIESDAETDTMSNTNTVLVREVQEEYLKGNAFLRHEYQTDYMTNTQGQDKIHFFRFLNYSVTGDNLLRSSYVQNTCQNFSATAHNAIFNTLLKQGENAILGFHGNVTVCFSQGCLLNCTDVIINGIMARAPDGDRSNNGNPQTGHHGSHTYKISNKIYSLRHVLFLVAFVTYYN